MPAYVPYPPSHPPVHPPATAPVELDGVWRVHSEPDPLNPPRYSAGRWRFDAPDGSYPVTYANLTDKGAFAEVYADRREIGPGEADRRLSQACSTAPLELIQLEDPGTLSGLGLDTNISTVRVYTRTMQWSARLREWYPDADGISYLGRKAASHTNYCFFLDRCAGKLRFEEVGRLRDRRSQVMDACDSLHLAPRLFDPNARRGWPGRSST